MSSYDKEDISQKIDDLIQKIESDTIDIIFNNISTIDDPNRRFDIDRDGPGDTKQVSNDIVDSMISRFFYMYDNYDENVYSFNKWFVESFGFKSETNIYNYFDIKREKIESEVKFIYGEIYNNIISSYKQKPIIKKTNTDINLVDLKVVFNDKEIEPKYIPNIQKKLKRIIILTENDTLNDIIKKNVENSYLLTDIVSDLDDYYNILIKENEYINSIVDDIFSNPFLKYFLIGFFLLIILLIIYSFFNNTQTQNIPIPMRNQRFYYPSY